MPPSNGGAEWEVGTGRGVSFSPDYGIWGSVVSSPGGVWGGAPARNAFRSILKAAERSRLHLYADALSSSNSVSCHIWGQGRGFGAIAPSPQRITAPAIYSQFVAANREK